MGIVSSNNIISTINSLMIAILLTASFLSRITASFGLIKDGFIPLIYISTLIISYGTVLLMKYRIFRIDKYNIILLNIILLHFMITFLFKGIDSYASVYFVEFIFYGFITYLLIILPYSSINIIYFTMLIGNLILINPIGIVEFMNSEFAYGGTSMGGTYGMLPCAVATIIYLFFIPKKKNKILEFVSYISNGYLLFVIVTTGSRGASLAIVTLIIFIAAIKISQKIKKGEGFIYIFSLAFIYMTSIFVILNLNKILGFILNMLMALEVEIIAISRTINLIESKGFVGVLNARDKIYEDAIELFFDSPLIGHGIGSFADIYNGQYPHNIFLQLMVEGGILITIPFTIVFILTIWILIKPTQGKKISELRLILLFLFIVSIPRLTLSSYFWMNPAFWVLIYILFSNIPNLYKGKKNNGFLSIDNV